jgi:biopolymer transport protein ExbB
MFELLDQGGSVMYVLLFCSVTALAVTIERVVNLARAARAEEEFRSKISEMMLAGSIREAGEFCESGHTPSARVCGAALAKHGSPRTEVREAAEDAGGREVGRLSRYLNVLSTIAMIAPLLGLLGTVLGMMETFARIKAQAGGLVDPDLLAGGIQKALLTTAFGLSVTIPTIIAYAALSAWVNRMIGRTERTATAVVEMVSGAGAAGEGGK